MKKNVRTLLASGVGCILVFGGIFSYQYLFTSGLEHLPQKVCSGSVDREIALKALPPSRSAEEGDDTGTPGQHFFFTCHVSTNGDSILSGESKTADSSVANWVRFYTGKRDGELVRTDKGSVKVLSVSGGLASVYVPCTPPDINPDTAIQSYALITEARTVGETRAKNDELRQVVTDFAYAITKHAYKVGKCQEAKSLPPDLSNAY